MFRFRQAALLAVVLVMIGVVGYTRLAQPVQAAGAITFSTPTIVDPIHTFGEPDIGIDAQGRVFVTGDRKSTRLNSSHLVISYAVFCLKKKKTTVRRERCSRM